MPDLNGDGRANTLLDGTIAGFEALNASVVAAGVGGSDVAIVPFSSNASISFVGTANSNVSAALRTLRDGGLTDFEAALQSTITALNQAGEGENRVFFISDGANNEGGSLTDEVATLLAANGLNAEIRAIGLGNNADLNDLDLVDDGIANNSAERVLTPSTLSAGLTGTGVDPSEIDRVVVLVNGVVARTIPAADLTVTPFGLRYETTVSGLSVSDEDRIEVRLVASDPASTTARVALDPRQRPLRLRPRRHHRRRGERYDRRQWRPRPAAGRGGRRQHQRRRGQRHPARPGGQRRADGRLRRRPAVGRQRRRQPQRRHRQRLRLLRRLDGGRDRRSGRPDGQAAATPRATR